VLQPFYTYILAFSYKLVLLECLDSYSPWAVLDFAASSWAVFWTVSAFQAILSFSVALL